MSVTLKGAAGSGNHPDRSRSGPKSAIVSVEARHAAIRAP
jgi:hypothetical protein